MCTETGFGGLGALSVHSSGNHCTDVSMPYCAARQGTLAAGGSLEEGRDLEGCIFASSSSYLLSACWLTMAAFLHHVLHCDVYAWNQLTRN